MADDQIAAISQAISEGSLFVGAELDNGSTESGLVLIEGVQPRFTALSGDNEVPPVMAFSNGSGFLNVNTLTGDYTTAVNINLNPADLDPSGIPQVITMVHIHFGGPTENVPPGVFLEDTGNNTTWVANGTFTTGELSDVIEGNSYFNVHGTDGSGLIRGQIPAL